MDPAAIERRIQTSAAAPIIVEPRLLRRLIKAHRALPGLGLSVPHAGCYALRRDALLALIDPGLVSRTPASLPEQVILVARPEHGEIVGRPVAEVLTRLWRLVFHAQVHLALDERTARGELSDAAIRERIARIGQIEFDEIRSAIRGEDRLLPPGSDREVYAEFCALYLELRHFAPRLLTTMFPGLPLDGRVDAVLALDVDPTPLLDASFPEGAEKAATVVRSPARKNATTIFTATSFTLFKGLAPPRPTGEAAAALLREADEARRRGNAARAAILRFAGRAEGPQGDAAAAAAARVDLESLGTRLNEALAASATPGEGARPGPTWTPLLVMLAEQAALRRSLRYPIEARLLFDLQRAALAHEKPERAIDLVASALSAGKTPIVRPLPATREVKVARHVHRAIHKVHRVRIASADRKLLAKLLRWAGERADDNVRAALRPKIKDALDAVGLRPENLPERTARGKLIEELLDEITLRGFIGIGKLRDAISRNQLKQGDLQGPRALFAGDELLKADRRLRISLDGVYRGGEIYLRLLQKVSSVAFGTRPGRLITLYILLPLIAAFVVLEGVSHLIAPLLRALDVEEVHLLSIPSFIVTAAFIFGLLHSVPFREASRSAAIAVGHALKLVFFGLPRFLLDLPPVRRILASPVTRALTRRLLVPLAVALLIVFLTPLHEEDAAVAIGSGMAIFGLFFGVMSSPIGALLEDALLDWLGPALQAVGRRILPGLFRLIVETFRALMDLVERVLYRVDEWLRFREGDPRSTIAPKAFFGLFWFAIAYVIRLYVTILIEPEVNPLKHFPVVTVSHKLLLPFSADILHALSALFAPLGAVIGGTMAAITAFLLPSAAGFLVWELKENWKLYRDSRPVTLTSALVGHHGETMSALLVPGFHAGTLPKLYARARRAAQRDDEAALGKPQGIAGEKDRTPDARAEAHLREGLAAVEDAVEHFVERELVALLLRVRRWTHGPLEVNAVEPGSNRLRVRIACPKVDGAPAEISFEEQSGFLVASVSRAGFLDRLPEESDGRRLFENALVGLYQLAGVDLVREQIEDVLGKSTPYDIADEGLVAWPGEGYRTEVVYPLHARHEDDGPILTPIVRGDPLSAAPPALPAPRLRFRRQPTTWAAWVRAWSAAEQPGAALPRLAAAPILPAAPRQSMVSLSAIPRGA